MPEYDEWGSGGTGSPEVEPEMVAALEALLFISDEGLTDERLASALDQTIEVTRAALTVLQARLLQPGSGIVVREQASGWRLTTAPECAPVLERFVIDGHSSRLSPAALETLAVVAYQQPVSRGRIAAIRGVAVDGVMRTLVARGLVEEVGAEASGALLYATTGLFMDKLGVKTLTELPELAPLLPDIETLDGFLDRPVTADREVPGAMPSAPDAVPDASVPDAGVSGDQALDAPVSDESAASPADVPRAATENPVSTDSATSPPMADTAGADTATSDAAGADASSGPSSAEPLGALHE